MIHLVVVDEPAQVPRRAAHEPVYGTVDEHDHLSHDHASTVSTPDGALVQIRRRRVPNPIAVPKRRPHAGAARASGSSDGGAVLDYDMTGRRKVSVWNSACIPDNVPDAP
jgi:hypothetical protein